MTIWILMVITVLFIPITMIGFGKLFMELPPDKINILYGYRTTMSMKNSDTWEYAHHYIGKLWLKIGFISLIPTIIAMVYVYLKDLSIIESWVGTIVWILVIVMLITIFLTEIELKKTFDKEGNRLTN
jgi:uncharacterized membrane protein